MESPSQDALIQNQYHSRSRLCLPSRCFSSLTSPLLHRLPLSARTTNALRISLWHRCLPQAPCPPPFTDIYAINGRHLPSWLTSPATPHAPAAVASSATSASSDDASPHAAHSGSDGLPLPLSPPPPASLRPALDGCHHDSSSCHSSWP